MARTFTFLTILCGVVSALATSAHNGRRDHHEKLIRVRSSNHTTEFGKRDFQNTRFTFYEAGLGACGGHNSDSDFIVAMNSDQYNGGQYCYQTITISYEGKSTQAQVVDECPTCPYGALDLTPSLFQYFASLDAGEIYGSWSFGSGSEPTTTSSKKHTTTSSVWTPTSTSTWSSTSTTHKSTSTSTWSSSSTSSSTSSTSTSTSSSSTSSSAPTPSSDSTLDELNYAIIQMGQIIASGAQVTLAIYETD